MANGGYAHLDPSTGKHVLAQMPVSILAGTDTLSSGTVTIAAAITASSRIIITHKDPNPGAGSLTISLAAPVASRNVGAGTFVVRANIAAGTINVLDNSTFDWLVIN